MSLLDQNLLTLDFWQNSVSYGNQTLPTGSIACAALNITDDQIAELTQLCLPLNTIILMVGAGAVTAEAFSQARHSMAAITKLLCGILPFSCIDFPEDGHDLQQIFSDSFIENALDYITATQTMGAAAALDPRFKNGVGLLKLIQVMAQLGSTLQIFKQSMTEFANVLHNSKRTPGGYAAVFAGHFTAQDLTDPSWMAMTNITTQYVSAVMPDKDVPQLVKRMHYVSYVGMFRSDLFEGLCVGHAPRKCPICGRWFLTTDARLTKYCGGLAPDDARGRTCRQIGNLKGREQRELADDHPIKAIYERRMNSIRQGVRRGTLDENTAAVMKRLGKNKMEKAISDHMYAKGSYESEMTQEALLVAATEIH